MKIPRKLFQIHKMMLKTSSILLCTGWNAVICHFNVFYVEGLPFQVRCSESVIDLENIVMGKFEGSVNRKPNEILS